MELGGSSLSGSVLIMWGEGTDAVESVRDSLVDKLEGQGYCVHLLRNSQVLVPRGENSPELAVTVERRPAARAYQDDFQSFLERSDYAVALIAEKIVDGLDSLTPTSRGNVWIEWMYWVSYHSDRTLLTVLFEDEPPGGRLDFRKSPRWATGAFGDAGAEHWQASLRAESPSKEHVEAVSRAIVMQLTAMIEGARSVSHA